MGQLAVYSCDLIQMFQAGADTSVDRSALDIARESANRGSALAQSGDYVAAAEAFGLAAAGLQGEERARAYESRGSALAQSGEFAAAAEAFGLAAGVADARQGERLAERHADRGIALYLGGHYAAANDAYLRAFSTPDGLRGQRAAEVHMYRARALARMGQHQEARSAYRAAADSPDLPEGQRNGLSNRGITANPARRALRRIVGQVYAAAGHPQDGSSEMWAIALAPLGDTDANDMHRLLHRYFGEEVRARGGERVVAGVMVPTLDRMVSRPDTLAAAVEVVRIGTVPGCVNQPAATFGEMAAVVEFADSCAQAESLEACIDPARGLRARMTVSAWVAERWASMQHARGSQVEVEAGNVMVARVNLERIDRRDRAWPGVPHDAHVAYADFVRDWVTDGRVADALRASDRARQTPPEELTQWLCEGVYAPVWRHTVRRFHGAALGDVEQRFDRYAEVVEERKDQFGSGPYVDAMNRVAASRRSVLDGVMVRVTADAAQAAAQRERAPLPMPRTPVPSPKDRSC